MIYVRSIIRSYKHIDQVIGDISSQKHLFWENLGGCSVVPLRDMWFKFPELFFLSFHLNPFDGE